MKAAMKAAMKAIMNAVVDLAAALLLGDLAQPAGTQNHRFFHRPPDDLGADG
jgi:hypothetical protein